MPDADWLDEIVIAELIGDGARWAVVAEDRLAFPLVRNGALRLRVAPPAVSLSPLPGGGLMIDAAEPDPQMAQGRIRLLDMRASGARDLLDEVLPTLIRNAPGAEVPAGFEPVDGGLYCVRDNAAGKDVRSQMEEIRAELTRGSGQDLYDRLATLVRDSGLFQDFGFRGADHVVLSLCPEYLVSIRDIEEAIGMIEFPAVPSGRPSLSLRLPRFGALPVIARLRGIARLPEPPQVRSVATWGAGPPKGREWSGILREASAGNAPVLLVELNAAGIELQRIDLLLPALSGVAVPEDRYDPLAIYEQNAPEIRR